MIKKLFKNKNEIIFFFILPILASLISIIFKTSFFISVLLFFGGQAIYFSLKNKRKALKAIIFCLFATPLIFIIDYFASWDNSWIIPTVFSFKILGTNSLEGFIWSWFYIYTIIMFYEHFLEKTKDVLIHPRMKYALIFISSIVGVFVIGRIFLQNMISTRYFYFIGALIGWLFPTFMMLIRHPTLIRKYLITGSYFLYLSILEEIVGQTLNHWYFPGTNFIGWINFFSHKIPLEEFVVFIILGAMGVLSYYEFFDDDRK
jgi:hypothetical protein